MRLMELRNVIKTYRQGGIAGRRRVVRAVDGVCLDIDAGRCLALVGHSGSGKSTLGRLALGLERPDSGDVLYKGRPWSSLHGEERIAARRNVQVVFQNSHDAVNPRFTAADIVGEPLRNFDRLRGVALERRVAELLESVGLDASDMRKLPHQFSGGELQRVCLARALAPKPEFIVLDESVSSLDMLNQSRILSLVADLRERSGAAFLFISHDLRGVCKVADSLAVMDGGRLVEYHPDVDFLDDFHRCGPALAGLAQAVLPAEPARAF